MLTYVPPEQRPAPPTYERPWLLLLLAFVWLWPGVFAHDLWQDEISVYAVIRQAAEGGQWWLPQDGGTLFWDVPPLYMWLSLLFLKLFGHLPPYEAVRMVNALLAAVSLAAMGGAGRMLLGRRNGRTAVLVLIGCPGLLMMSHFIGGQIVTLCGLSLSFYALAM
ncbi:MAG: glycosyltransferase family 39 protein, partial [Eikenella corrodens]|nr:glycosyltransferase family 39 protein [Eikenella corrodens]